VVLGPGSVEQAHTAREFVEVRQVEAMADFFVRILEGAA
jgi:acetylornithine deacetylase/succinyl-diaminopimelate desuccinylase-like protein